MDENYDSLKFGQIHGEHYAHVFVSIVWQAQHSTKMNRFFGELSYDGDAFELYVVSH